MFGMFGAECLTRDTNGSCPTPGRAPGRTPRKNETPATRPIITPPLSEPIKSASDAFAETIFGLIHDFALFFLAKNQSGTPTTPRTPEESESGTPTTEESNADTIFDNFETKKAPETPADTSAASIVSIVLSFFNVDGSEKPKDNQELTNATINLEDLLEKEPEENTIAGIEAHIEKIVEAEKIWRNESKDCDTTTHKELNNKLSAKLNDKLTKLNTTLMERLVKEAPEENTIAGIEAHIEKINIAKKNLMILGKYSKKEFTIQDLKNKEDELNKLFGLDQKFAQLRTAQDNLENSNISGPNAVVTAVEAALLTAVEAGQAVFLAVTEEKAVVTVTPPTINATCEKIATLIKSIDLRQNNLHGNATTKQARTQDQRDLERKINTAVQQIIASHSFSEQNKRSIERHLNNAIHSSNSTNRILALNHLTKLLQG